MEALDNSSLISFPLISLSYRTSIFYNLVLAVSRTVKILKPLKQINTKLIAVFCVIYPMVWLGIIIYDLYEGKAVYDNYSYMTYTIAPYSGIYLANTFGYWCGEEFCNYIIFLVLFVIPFLIPVVIVIISCILQIVSLLRRTIVTSSGPTDNRDHVTITILMISAVFAICNTPFAIYIPILYLGNGMEELIQKLQMATFYILMILGSLFPMVNAMCNPIVIITRSERIKRFVKERIAGNVEAADRGNTIDMTRYSN